MICRKKFGHPQVSSVKLCTHNPSHHSTPISIICVATSVSGMNTRSQTVNEMPPKINKEGENALLESIRQIIKEELAVINRNIDSLSDDIKLAMSTANEAKSLATEVKTTVTRLETKIPEISQLATNADETSKEAKQIANEASSKAIEALNTANEARSLIDEKETNSEEIPSPLIRNLQEELALCQEERDKLFNRTLRLEAYSRRSNLKFEGIAETKGEDTPQVLRQYFHKMNLDPSIGIVACHRYGQRKAKPKEPRPIVVKFLTFNDRDTVWNNRRTLKGTKVMIREDYPSEIEERRKILRPYLVATFDGDPKNPKGRVSAFMTLDKLVINNQTFSYKTIEHVPEYIKYRVANPIPTKQTDNIIIFFTKGSPLSNFHPSVFEVDDKRFLHVEQYLTYNKAILFGATEIAEEILSMEDPKLMKQKVKHLKDYDEKIWHEKAPALLNTALTAKFTQNKPLGDELLSTGTRIIGEASPSDTLFGIGLSLRNPQALDADNWEGKNLQGNALMEIREILSQLSTPPTQPV